MPSSFVILPQSLVAEKGGFLAIHFCHKARVSISQLSVPFFSRSISSDSVETTLTRWYSNLIPEALQIEDHWAIKFEFLGRCPLD